jgi:hypothetical protein
MLTHPAALLLQRGLAVFPLPAGSKAAPAGWHESVTTDPAVVAAWPAAANIGVGCRASGIVGLDLDRADDADGVDTLAVLCAAARRPWPATLTITTAHGGQHLYYRAPAGIVVPSSIRRWPGIDVRAPGRHLGGYLVGPGSLVDGQPYTVSQDLPIAPLPRWITAQLTATRGGPPRVSGLKCPHDVDTQ